jgi:hypothetical protein
MSRKIYVVGGYTEYANWMGPTGLVSSVAEADLVVFTGGTDVDSLLYNEPRHPMTQHPNKSRDAHELSEFKKALDLGKHICGVCRGAQLMCVLSGGRLVQHQQNRGSHKIETTSGRFIVTSDHHQAQYPWGIPRPPQGYTPRDTEDEGWEILGWTRGQSEFHLGGRGEEMLFEQVEVEDVIYRHTKALAIQSHPEWQFPPSGGMEAETINYYQKLLNLHMEDKL